MIRDYKADEELIKQTKVQTTIGIEQTVVILTTKGPSEELYDLIRKGLPWYVERCKELEKLRTGLVDEAIALGGALKTENQRLREALEIAKSYMPWSNVHAKMGDCKKCGKTTVNPRANYCTECACQIIEDVLKGESKDESI